MQIFYLLCIGRNRKCRYIDILIFNPAYMLIRKLFHTDFYIILIFQTVLKHLKLQDAYNEGWAATQKLKY